MKIPRLLAIVLLASELAAAPPEKGLFDNPFEMISESLVPALSHCEDGKIKKTWRGFYLRADSHSGMRDETSPSSLGIYMDVAVRDAVEIPVFKDTSKIENSLTKRTVEIPAAGKDPRPLARQIMEARCSP